MSYTLEVYFLLFISYSVLGWLLEVSLKLIEKKRFVDRGLFIGPYCPIYGFGAIFIIVLLRKYLDDYVALFFFSMIIASILEYSTSYVLEKIFHARWWDYSKWRFNLNGRICLETMIPFGFCSLLIMYVLNPFFLDLFGKLNLIGLHTNFIILYLLISIDFILTFSALIEIRKDNKLIFKGDNTEEMALLIKEKIKNRNWIYKRILKAFPDIKKISDDFFEFIKEEYDLK